MDLQSATLAQVLEAVAADRPAPGAGAAAGLALALGAACASKALRITGRRRDDRELASAAVAAETLASRAVTGAQADCEDFPELLAAPEDRCVRDQLRDDGEGSLHLCRELRTLIDTYADRVERDLAGDLAAALHLVAAAEAVITRNLAELGSPEPRHAGEPTPPAP